MLRVVIIEDELPAIEELKYLLSMYDWIEVVGQAQDGGSGLKLIEALKPDVAFIDINIPKINGIELSKFILHSDINIYVVFTTAYDEYAIEAFDLNALDYLLKPISVSRLNKSLEKIKTFLKLKENHEYLKINKIAVEKNGKIVMVDFKEIIFAKSQMGNVSIFSKNEEYFYKDTMKALEDKLNHYHNFYRVQKSYIVNLEEVLEVIPWFKSTYWLIMNDEKKTRIPVSKAQVKQLKLVLGIR